MSKARTRLPHPNRGRPADSLEVVEPEFEPTPELRRLLEDLKHRVDAFYAELPPIDWELMERLNELQQFETTMQRLGMVAHPLLLEQFRRIKTRDVADAITFAAEAWPNVSQELSPTAAHFGDARSVTLFGSMIAAHNAGLYELVPIAAASLMERVMGLVRREGSPVRRDEWLKQVVGRLEPVQLGGLPGIRVWQVLVDHTFSQCWGDATADSLPFMNRHALAHGRGNKPATLIDSFNALLLAHFVFWIAIVVSDEAGLEAGS